MQIYCMDYNSKWYNFVMKRLAEEFLAHVPKTSFKIIHCSNFCKVRVLVAKTSQLSETFSDTNCLGQWWLPSTIGSITISVF